MLRDRVSLWLIRSGFFIMFLGVFFIPAANKEAFLRNAAICGSSGFVMMCIGAYSYYEEQ